MSFLKKIIKNKKNEVKIKHITGYVFNKDGMLLAEKTITIDL